jgi:hypothetical protein
MLSRGKGLRMALGVALCGSLVAMGQTAPVSVGPAPAGTAAEATTPIITVSQAAKWLTGPWKFSPGDSPWVNGAPLLAQPNFDDERWAAMDLAPQSGLKDPTLNTNWYVPGWTARGYPNLVGFAWYRLRLRVNAGQRLSIDMPSDFDDAYQVYVNGRFVGEYGQFKGRWVDTYSSLPESFTVPPQNANGDMLIALRFYMNPATIVGTEQPGGMHQPPMLGLTSMTGLVLQSENAATLRTEFANLVMLFLYLVLAAPMALWAWRANRRERSWLWLFLVMVQQIITAFLNVTGNLVTLPFWSYNLFYNVLFAPLGRPLWILFWWQWFGLKQKRWIPWAAWLLTVGRALCELVVSAPYFGNITISPLWLTHCDTLQSWMLGAQGLLLVMVLVEGFRHEVTDALLASLPIGLLVLTTFPKVGVWLSSLVGFYPYGIPVSAQSIVQLLLISGVGALAWRRFLHTRVRDELNRQALAQDLEQAQQLQQRVLVPETVPSPYFSIEAEYLPAQSVGGDFFQMVAGADGSLLVVVGDVSGKGVSAAMLVAVLVGALCTRAKTSFDPVEMLTTLNERLVGRGMGHLATCVVAELRPDGAARVANAGHLSPYLKGEEVSLDGSLPLGSTANIEPSVTSFHLEPGDVLTFITDGVVEAMDGSRELFGFERAQAISGKAAAAIAQQAAEFGQCDDITVVRVEFVGAAQESLKGDTVAA